jgi:transposase-like protein
VTYPSSQPAGPIDPRLREGHRRRFSEEDKQWILKEAALPDVSAAEVARRYGIDQRVLRRWKQELAATALAFVTVKVTDAGALPCATSTAAEAVS